MELRHLRYFVAVTESGSIVGASKRLNVAQPALSTQIHDLERELGVTLLERTSRGVRLTAAGTEFLGHARAVLASSAIAVEEVRRHAHGVVALRMQAFDELPAFRPVMRAALARFRADWPRVSIQFEFVPWTDQARALRSRELDLGFAFGVPADVAGVRLRPILSFVSDGVLLSATHPLADVRELSVADLSRYPFHAIAPRGAPPVLLQAPGWRARQIPARDPAQLRAMTAMGDGWSLGDRSHETVDGRGLVYRPLADGIAIPWSLNALCRESPEESHTEGFVSALLDACADAALPDRPPRSATPADATTPDADTATPP